jgi:hypothetical protein
MTKTLARLIGPVKVLRAANAVLSVASWWVFLGNVYQLRWGVSACWLVLSYAFFALTLVCDRALDCGEES